MNEGGQFFLELIFGNPDADSDRNCFSAFRIKPFVFQGGPNSLCDSPGFLAPGFRQYHRKFFPAIAVGGIIGPQTGFNYLAEPDQDLISFKVPEFIVVIFEVIYVEQQQCERVAVAIEAVNFQFELGVKRSGIIKPCKAVGDCQLLQLFHHPDTFIGKFALFEHPLQPEQKLFEADRLDDEIAGADVDRLFIGIIVAVAGHYDDIGSTLFFDDLGELQAPHFGQHDIRNNDVEGFVCQQFEGILRAGNRVGIEPGGFDILEHGIAHSNIVIDD